MFFEQIEGSPQSRDCGLDEIAPAPSSLRRDHAPSGGERISDYERVRGGSLGRTSSQKISANQVQGKTDLTL